MQALSNNRLIGITNERLLSSSSVRPEYFEIGLVNPKKSRNQVRIRSIRLNSFMCAVQKPEPIKTTNLTVVDTHSKDNRTVKQILTITHAIHDKSFEVFEMETVSDENHENVIILKSIVLQKYLALDTRNGEHLLRGVGSSKSKAERIRLIDAPIFTRSLAIRRISGAIEYGKDSNKFDGWLPLKAKSEIKADFGAEVFRQYSWPPNPIALGFNGLERKIKNGQELLPFLILNTPNKQLTDRTILLVHNNLLLCAVPPSKWSDDDEPLAVHFVEWTSVADQLDACQFQYMTVDRFQSAAPMSLQAKSGYGFIANGNARDRCFLFFECDDDKDAALATKSVSEEEALELTLVEAPPIYFELIVSGFVATVKSSGEVTMELDRNINEKDKFLGIKKQSTLVRLVHNLNNTISFYSPTTGKFLGFERDGEGNFLNIYFNWTSFYLTFSSQCIVYVRRRNQQISRAQTAEFSCPFI